MKFYQLVLVILALALTAPVNAAGAADCQALRELRLEKVTRVQVARVPAGTFIDQNGLKPVRGGPLPAFCRVQITVEPQIGLEVWLPETGWNNRYRSEGGGTFGGFFPYDRMAQALRKGYATASTDAGHRIPDGSFALHATGGLNYSAIENFAWRSLRELVVKAKTVTKAYYGRSARYTYWNGCSLGGRQGLTSVQRFWQEYDGVLAGCPAINWERLIAAELWPQIVMRHEVGGPIAPEKLGLASKAATAACDGLDGVIDGIVDDPRLCEFDPSVLVCDERKKRKTCLTRSEAIAIQRIWSGPQSRTGRLAFAIERGVPSVQWEREPTGMSASYLKYWMAENANADASQISELAFEAYLDQSVKKFGGIFKTDDTTFLQDRKLTGKVIIWHGEADPLIPPRSTINYYLKLIRVAGGAEALSKSIRLFMVPGASHCSSPKAPFPEELFDSLVAWVEKGEAPDSVMGKQLLANGSTRTRPVCAWPKLARWTGRGSSDDAKNFTCGSRDIRERDFATKYD